MCSSDLGQLKFINVTDPDAHWQLGGKDGRRYVQRLDRINDHLVLAMWRGGQLDLVEMPSGKIRWSRETRTLGSNILDSAITPDGKRLLLLIFNRKRRFMVQFLNISDGRSLFGIPLGRSFNNLHVRARTLACSGPVLPYLNIANNRKPDAIRFLRATDGKPLDMQLHGDKLNNLFRELIQPPIIRNHTLILTTRTATYAFGVKPGEKAEPVKVLDTPLAVKADRNDGGETIATINGITLRIRNGQVEVQTSGGGTIHAGNITINQNGRKIEIKRVNGQVEVRVNGKLIPINKKPHPTKAPVTPTVPRSEERRVGKECRSRWSPYHEKQNSIYIYYLHSWRCTYATLFI